MSIQLNCSKVHKEAKLPTKGSDSAAGYDLYSVESVLIPAQSRASVKTGLKIALDEKYPNKYYFRIAPRSGLANNYGIDVSAGVIDSDYRGEIIVILFNHSNGAVDLAAGCRIAQLIPELIFDVKPVWTEDSLTETERGENGFGSTGQ